MTRPKQSHRVHQRRLLAITLRSVEKIEDFAEPLAAACREGGVPACRTLLQKLSTELSDKFFRELAEYIVEVERGWDGR